MSYTFATSNGRGTRPTISASIKTPSFDDGTRRLRDACARYRRVLYIGDSMGASASLMFAEHATRVLAFCPQVDLYASSIRPSRSNVWFKRFRRPTRGFEAPSADADVHTGSWAHDTHQASLLPSDKVTHVVHRVDSHRLALALDGEDKLLPIVRDALTAKSPREATPRTKPTLTGTQKPSSMPSRRGKA